MPLPIAHGLFGASIVAAIMPKPFKFQYLVPCFIGGVLANLPDFDFALVFITGDEKWHRGFTHSIAFAVFIGLLFYFYFGRKRRREAAAFGFAFASHFFLDFITTKIGGGLELFFPFSAARYGLRWFGLSEFPSKMYPLEVVQALVIESIIFSALFLLVIFLKRNFYKPEKELL